MLTPEQIANLHAAACEAASRAYAPYSNFHVGAALLLAGGEVIIGCNVENASFGVTLCAERTAAVSAVAAAAKDWRAIVVVSPTGVSPCGACRQFLSEFAPALEVHYGRSDRPAAELQRTSLDLLLPAQMTLK